jgi:hypothetical protein
MQNNKSSAENAEPQRGAGDPLTVITPLFAAVSSVVIWCTRVWRTCFISLGFFFSISRFFLFASYFITTVARAAIDGFKC